MLFSLFVLLLGCGFVLFVHVKSFRKKKKKEFKIALMTSFNYYFSHVQYGWLKDINVKKTGVGGKVQEHSFL